MGDADQAALRALDPLPLPTRRADGGKDLLQHCQLIGREGVISHEAPGVRLRQRPVGPLQRADRGDVSAGPVIHRLQLRSFALFLLQNPLLEHHLDVLRGQVQAEVEAIANLVELVLTADGLAHDLFQGFLSRDDQPQFAQAPAGEGLGDGLQLQQPLVAVADELPHFVNDVHQVGRLLRAGLSATIHPSYQLVGQDRRPHLETSLDVVNRLGSSLFGSVPVGENSAQGLDSRVTHQHVVLAHFLPGIPV